MWHTLVYLYCFTINNFRVPAIVIKVFIYSYEYRFDQISFNWHNIWNYKPVTIFAFQTFLSFVLTVILGTTL